MSDPGAGYGFESDHTYEGDWFFFHTGHLGSTSYLTDTAGNVSQFVCYTPYGEAIVDEHLTTYENPFKFSGKELDEITGLYDHGARSRNPISTLWYGVDALWERNYGTSPYIYCAGRPLNYIDPSGNDSIAVLNAPDGAGGMGHMAILIQDEEQKWRLWSKNGTEKMGGIYGPTPSPESNSDKAPNVGDGDSKTKKGFNSIDEFLSNNELNPVQEKTQKREYQEAYALETTSEQNRAAEAAMRKDLVGENSTYNVLGDNCATAVQRALDAAGKVGTKVFEPNTDNLPLINKIPKVIYHEIKIRNEGGQIFKPNSK